MKVSSQPDLPPVLSILLAEKDLFRDPSMLAKRFEDMRDELTRQADWTIQNFPYSEDLKRTVDSFVTAPMAGMDPLGWTGSCSEFECKLGASIEFARTVGVYSDVTILSDPFTSLFHQLERRLTPDELTYICTRLAVARVLEPLIRNGVIRFKSPYSMICRTCLSKMDSAIETFADQYVRQRLDVIDVHRDSEKTFSIDLGDAFEPGLVFPTRLDRRAVERYEDPKRRTGLVIKLARDLVAKETRDTVIGATYASHAHAVVLSNSRLALTGILDLEDRLPDRTDFEFWEGQRSATLPWLRDLSPIEVLQLRAEADTALPRFRTRLAKTLRPRASKAQGDDSWGTLVDELREDAENVKAEIGALGVKWGKRVRNNAGTLALGVSLYGLATDVPSLAFATLFAGLTIAHSGRREEQEQAKLISRPGYVLVKAQDILKHRRH